MVTVRLFSLRHWWAAVGLALLAAFAAVGATVTEPKRVLLVHFFGTFRALYYVPNRTGQRLGEPVDLHEVPLLTGRNGAPPEDAPFVDYLLGLFPQRPPDLVVTIGGPALRLAQRQRQRFFRKLECGSNRPTSGTCRKPP